MTHNKKLWKVPKKIIYAIDATGTLVRHPSQYETKKYEIMRQVQKPVYLYLIMLISKDKKSVPVCQMLSDSHSSESIERFLSFFMKKVKQKPSEIRIDCSAALMCAISKGLNKCETKEYMKKCYDAITYKSDPPTTLMRLDKSHFYKIINRWKFWITTSCGKIIKNFYISILMKFISETSFEIIKKNCANLVILMNSKFENNETNASLNEIYAYMNDKNCEEAHEDQIINIDEEQEFDEDFNCDDNWIKNMFDDFNTKNSNLNDQHSKINPYYLPQFKNDFIRIMFLCPMWTNIMKNLVDYGFEKVSSTSGVESQFTKIL